MTPPDSQPTAPPTVAPATDEEIADTFSRANRVTGIGSVRALKLIARIESDRAENFKLRARVADLEALMMEAYEDVHSWGGYASDYYQKKHDLTGCAEKYRRAALKPEPASR